MALRNPQVDQVDVEEVDEVVAGHSVVVDELQPGQTDDTSGEER
jgi:hypothetical protein